MARRLLIALAVCLAPPGHGQGELPRLAVGGGQRVGYGGILLRAGLPFDYLTPAEQADPRALDRYDALLMADLIDGLEPWRDDARAALERFVRAGGGLLTELGADLPLGQAGWRREGRGPDTWPVTQTTRRLRLVAPGDPPHPFLKRFPAGREWPFGGWLARVEPAGEATVLARFHGPEVEGQPALFELTYGRGRVLYLAAGVSYVQGNWTPAYDDLILGAVDYLTGGRARRQWAPEPSPPVASPRPPEPAREPVPPPAGWQALGDGSTDGFALRLTRAPGEPPTEVRLEVTARRRYQLRVDASEVVLEKVVDGRTTRLFGAPGDPAGGEGVLLRTPTRLALVTAGQAVKTFDGLPAPVGTVHFRGGGTPLLQPLEPVFWGDDFTRAGDLGGEWRPLRGNWVLGGPPRPDSLIPGFAARGWRAAAAAGEWFWTDYTVSVAVRPRQTRGVWLEAARWDGANRLQLWLPVDRGRGRLDRFSDGQARPLAEGLPALTAHQWSTLTLSLTAGRVVARIDGQVVADAPRVDAVLGGIAVGFDGEALIDDVEVRPTTGPRLLPQVHPPGWDKGPDGLLDRDTWAHPAAAWQPTATPGLFWHVGRFTGDFTLRAPLRPSGRGAPRLVLHVAPERFRAPVLELDQAALANRRLIELKRQQGVLTAALDGRSWPLTRDEMRTGPVALGVEFAGLTLAAADLEVRAADVREYVFDRAPSDFWEASGEWSVGSRWPCMPQWAWLAGAGPREAVLWSKRRLLGDLAVQTWLSVRMLGRYASREGEPFERLRLTIAGDGRDPRSGYWVELGGPGHASRLYRRQVVVDSAPGELTYGREIHNFWADLRLERRGARLLVRYQGRPLLEFVDPEPLPDGQVALWTERNVVVTPYLALWGRAEEVVQPLPAGRRKERQERRGQRVARPGFNPLPVSRALTRLLGGEGEG